MCARVCNCAYACACVQLCVCVRACERASEKGSELHVAYDTSHILRFEWAGALRLRDQTTKPVHGLDLRGGNGTLVLMHYDL